LAQIFLQSHSCHDWQRFVALVRPKIIAFGDRGAFQ